MKLEFGVESWDAWAAGNRAKDEWVSLLNRSTIETHSLDKQDLLHLKPRQRRRLSDHSKISLDVSFGAAFGTTENQTMPTVFASRRGEVNRMADLLRDICTSGEASPTAFGLSVHNTTSGLFSIQSENQTPSTAIAAGSDTLVSALIEAYAQLANGYERVLLVISEDKMPEVYQSFGVQDEELIAAAFVLTRGKKYVLNLESSEQATQSTFKQISEFLKLIVLEQPVAIIGERMSCRLQLN